WLVENAVPLVERLLPRPVVQWHRIRNRSIAIEQIRLKVSRRQLQSHPYSTPLCSEDRADLILDSARAPAQLRERPNLDSRLRIGVTLMRLAHWACEGRPDGSSVLWSAAGRVRAGCGGGREGRS